MAFANIQIPLQLGDVVNNLTKCSTGQRVVDFWAMMRAPVTKIGLTYCIQVSTSSLHERVNK